ncbi:hypothetical protein ACOMHN_040965 [Nucella lapillus]
MADAKPNLARDGTMQVTAKEGIDYLKAEGKTKLLEFQKLEGIDYLKAEGKTKLLEFQGLAESEASKPGLPRDNTMAVTAKEGERLLETTGGAPDEDAQTRGQQRKLEEIKNETAPESPTKKARLAKDSTMAVTAKEAKDLLGKEKLGDTRQETARKSTGKPSPKRGVTMAKTLEEAKYLLEGKEVDVTEGRRTRSQSKPAPAKPPVKRAGTMQNTTKEGKDFLKRGKGKGKGKKTPADDAADKVEEKVEEEEAQAEEEEEEAKEDEKDAELSCPSLTGLAAKGFSVVVGAKTELSFTDWAGCQGLQCGRWGQDQRSSALGEVMFMRPDSRLATVMAQ